MGRHDRGWVILLKKVSSEKIILKNYNFAQRHRSYFLFLKEHDFFCKIEVSKFPGFFLHKFFSALKKFLIELNPVEGVIAKTLEPKIDFTILPK